jgi:hypothetical protein
MEKMKTVTAGSKPACSEAPRLAHIDVQVISDTVRCRAIGNYAIRRIALHRAAYHILSMVLLQSCLQCCAVLNCTVGVLRLIAQLLPWE